MPKAQNAFGANLRYKNVITFWLRAYILMDDKKGGILMNEKLQYAAMLEIPVNTCNITYKSVRKKKSRRRKNESPEDIKRALLEKVNSADSLTCLQEDKECAAEAAEEQNFLQTDYVAASVVHASDLPAPATMPAGRREQKSDARGKFAPSVITIELVMVGILLAVILLTSAFYPQSGINAFMQGVFSNETIAERVDERQYAEFAPVFNYGEQTSPVVEDGVITLPASGSVYAPCEGQVSAIYTDENGKYTVEIAHSLNFSSVITGLDHVYSVTGDRVLGTIPVGYARETPFNVCFKGKDGALITGYTLSDNAVVWTV